jgi:hypothetical protein
VLAYLHALRVFDAEDVLGDVFRAGGARHQKFDGDVTMFAAIGVVKCSPSRTTEPSRPIVDAPAESTTKLLAGRAA